MAPNFKGAIPSLGAGYDTFDGVVKGRILNVTHQNDQGPSEATSSYTVCKSVEEVMSALNIDASVEANAAWGSVSDKFSFAQKITRSSTSVVALLAITKVSQNATVERVEFADKFDDAVEMYKQGGDSYVSYLRQGGQYLAAYHYDAESIESQTKISNDLEASLGTYKGNLQVAVENYSSTSKVRLEFSQLAIGFGDNDLPKQEDMADFASKFNTMKLTQPDVLEFATELYESVKGHPDMDQIVKSHALYSRDSHGQKAYCTIEQAARKSKAAIEALADVYDFYHRKSVEPTLDQNLTKLTTLLGQITDWKYAVHRDPTSKTIPDLQIDLQSLLYPEPRLHLERSAAAGSSDGGDPFTGVELDMVIQCVYPKSIQVKAGVCIDQMNVVYGFKDGKRADMSQVHGEGGGGSLQEIFMLGQDQRVESVAAWDTPKPDDGHGWVVKNFETTFGDGTTRTFGNDGGNRFDQGYGDHKNWAFVGWNGRAGRYLDQLEAVYVVFEPANWKMPNFPDRNSEE